MTGPERTRTGLRALKAAVNLRGLSAISGRTAPGRAIIARKRALMAEYGGEAGLSPQLDMLIDLVVNTKLVLEHVEAHMLALHSLVGRRGKLKPIVAQRNQLAVVLDRALERLATHPAAIAARAQALEAAEQAAFEARHPR